MAEVYLMRDLAATVMQDAHYRDGARGNRRSRDGNSRRLLLWSARGSGADHLDEANEPDRAGQADDQAAGVADRAADALPRLGAEPLGAVLVERNTV